MKLLYTFLLVLTFTVPAAGAVITVTAGGDLQAALNQAQPGDEIVVAAGARFVGTFTLPVKAAGAAIIVRSSGAVPDRRVGPGDAALMPTLTSGSTEPALVATGTANWKLVGLRFESMGGNNTVIQLQDVKSVWLERLLYVAPASGQRRFIMGNGESVTLTKSYCAGVWAPSLQDSQCFAAWDGKGPYTITDNYLEAASENILFGGSDSKSVDRIPSDITITGNLVSKNLAWKGSARAVKNLFELKSAKRVTVRDNTFENNWADAQDGTAIVFTPRNQDWTAPWSTVEDVVFERNIVRNTVGVFNILGHDNDAPSGQATRITLRNNLLQGTGIFLKLGAEVGALTVDHNTVDQGYNITTMYYGDIKLPDWTSRLALYSVETLVFTNNLVNHNQYGMYGEGGTGTAESALTAMTKVWTFKNNVVAGDEPHPPFPPTTLTPTMTTYRANFVNFGVDYHLTATSAYRKAGTDAQDLGVIWSVTIPPRAPSTINFRSAARFGAYAVSRMLGDAQDYR